MLACDRIEQLKAEIEEHNKRYYEEDNPVISDAEYDLLFRELRDLEDANPDLKTPDSPTRRVGGKPLAGFTKVIHEVPLLSIDNAMNEEEAKAFVGQVSERLNVKPDELVFTAEPKYDGLAVRLVYTKGVLTLAATRGDGFEGENVTEQVATIKNVPLKIDHAPELLEVRGEVLMLKKTLETLNEKARKEGKKELANCRNAAAGALRQLDPKVTAQRDLRFFAYGIGPCKGAALAGRQYDLLMQLNGWGFEVSSKVERIVGFAGVQAYFAAMQADRASLEFDIDGTVLKVDRLDWQADLGWNNRVPRWAKAYKFPPEEVSTTILAIDIQIGRTGTATPVARLKPVKVGGVTVTNVTLHNMDEIIRLDARVGSTVIIRRAGDVIPQIVSASNSSDTVPFSMPAVCPCCQSALVKETDKVAYVCSGELSCPAQVIHSIHHFTGRTAMNIDGCGEHIITALLEHGLIKSVADLYKLTADDLTALPRFGPSSSKKLLEAIEQSRRVKLYRVIYSLGLPFVGERMSKLFAKTFKTWDAFYSATASDFQALESVGATTAETVFKALKANASVISRIIPELTIESEDPVGSKYAGQTFVITGSFSKPRDAIKALLEKEGAKVSDSVSKKTTTVIAGSEAGSKLTKAKDLGIPIWDEGLLALELPGYQ